MVSAGQIECAEISVTRSRTNRGVTHMACRCVGPVAGMGCGLRCVATLIIKSFQRRFERRIVYIFLDLKIVGLRIEGGTVESICAGGCKIRKIYPPDRVSGRRAIRTFACNGSATTGNAQYKNIAAISDFNCCARVRGKDCDLHIIRPVSEVIRFDCLRYRCCIGNLTE